MPGLLPVDTHYDAEGRVDAVMEGTRSATAQYGVTGFVTSTTDALGRVTLYPGRDAVGRVRSALLPGDRTVSFDYDASGNLKALTPPESATHQFSYTPRDLVSGYAPPSAAGPSGSTSYTYDFDRALLRLGAPGSAVTFTYDFAGRPLNIHHTYGSSTLSYDGAGRLASAATTDGAGALSWTYDGSLLTRIDTSASFLGSHRVELTYDNLFRVTNRTVDGTTPISRAYDADGLLTGLGGMTLTRSPTSGLLTGTTLGVVTDSYTYNGFGEVTDYTASIGGAPVLVLHYDRDAAGRIHKKQETSEGATHATRYEYDAAGRLWQVYLDQPDASTTPDRTYEYDANGNRLSGPAGSATYDAQDRLLTHGEDAFTYTANGELATRTTAGSSPTAYRYDVFGNLRRVTPPAPAMAIDYLVDAQNRRVGSLVNGAVNQALLYGAGGRVVAELGAGGSLRNVFGYATRPITPDILQRNGAAYRVITDHLGSPRLVVNASTGEIAQRMSFDEWGVVTSDSAPGFQPFGFAGGLYDRDTGLVRFGARDYLPTTGRWTTKDASRFGGGLNFYAYVNGDPANFVDADGHYAVAAVLMIVGAVIVAGALLPSDAPHEVTQSEATTAALGVGIMTAGLVCEAAPAWLAQRAILTGGAGSGHLIQSGVGQQGFRDPSSIDAIKQAMLNKTFNYADSPIAGNVDAQGTYYLTEGHHRMAAALEIARETGNFSAVQQLIAHGAWMATSSAPVLAGPLPTR